MSIHRSPAAAWRHVAGETIVMHLGQREMYGLNATGAWVWHQLESFSSLEALNASLAQPTISTEDLERFCSELRKLGLVVPGPASTSGRSHGFVPGLTADTTPPRVEWQESIAEVGGSCAMIPGMNDLCTANPFD